MHCYVDLDAVKNALGITLTTTDADLLEIIRQVSEWIDSHCGRHFYSQNGTRYFDTLRNPKAMEVDDLLSATSLKMDSELDGTYDGETWVENTDFWLRPNNEFPKTRVELTAFGNYVFAARQGRYAKIVGVWGYGDGRSATPWLTANLTVTAASAEATALTMSAAGLKAGQTILVEDEQIFLSAMASDGKSGTGVRGQNGTTAAAHTTKNASVALYPREVAMTARNLAAGEWVTRNLQGFETETREGHTFTLLRKPQIVLDRALGKFVRRGV